MLRCVLDTLHGELKNAAGKSVVSDSLGGVVASSVCCAACGSVSVSTEPFLDLCVEVPDRKTLEMLLAAASLPSPPNSAAAAAALLTAQASAAAASSASAEAGSSVAGCDGGWLASLGSWLGGSWLGALFGGDDSELDGIDVTLAQCLATYCKPELMTGENQVRRSIFSYLSCWYKLLFDMNFCISMSAASVPESRMRSSTCLLPRHPNFCV